MTKVMGMDLILNAAVFLITLFATLGFFHRDGEWKLSNGKKAFRFFTVLSNVFCAAASLLMCFAPSGTAVWLLKYVGTVAVTVTMLTVFLFLGPNMGYRELLKGRDLFMHLLTPLLALFSLCVMERRGLSFPAALLGLLPVAVYGGWYLYRVLYAPADRRWEDFYGFNKGGKWPLSFFLMLLGSFLICMALRRLLNA